MNPFGIASLNELKPVTGEEEIGFGGIGRFALQVGGYHSGAAAFSVETSPRKDTVRKGSIVAETMQLAQKEKDEVV